MERELGNGLQGITMKVDVSRERAKEIIEKRGYKVTEENINAFIEEITYQIFDTVEGSMNVKFSRDLTLIDLALEGTDFEDKEEE